MPDFAGSKTQRVNKYAGLRAPQTPQPGLQPGLHRKTTFCFSASITCRQTFKKATAASTPRQAFFTGYNTFRPSFHPSRRQPATAFRRISFHTSPHNLTLARNLHSGLTGQHASALIFSLSFFSSILLHAKKNRGKPAKPILLYFSYNPESSPNLVQAFPSQSLSLLFSPSNQYTPPHRPRSGHT